MTAPNLGTMAEIFYNISLPSLSVHQSRTNLLFPHYTVCSKGEKNKKNLSVYFLLRFKEERRYMYLLVLVFYVKRGRNLRNHVFLAGFPGGWKK